MKKIIIFIICFSIITLSARADDYDLSNPDKECILAYSNNGNFIASVNIVGKIRIYNSFTLEIIKTLEGRLIAARQIKFSPDDKYIAIASYGMQVFEIQNEKLLFETFNGNPSHRIETLSFSPDGKKIVLGDRIGFISIWDIFIGIETLNIDGSGSRLANIDNVFFSPDGNNILSTSYSGLKIWDVYNGNLLNTLSKNNTPFFFVYALFNPEKTIILLCYYKIGTGTIIEIYNADNYELLNSHIFENMKIIINEIVFIPNSFNIIIFADFWNQLITIDYTNGNIIKTIKSNLPLAISPDYKNIIYMEDNKIIKLKLD